MFLATCPRCGEQAASPKDTRCPYCWTFLYPSGGRSRGSQRPPDPPRVTATGWWDGLTVDELKELAAGLYRPDT
jgi:hypothetical protein